MVKQPRHREGVTRHCEEAKPTKQSSLFITPASFIIPASFVIPAKAGIFWIASLALAMTIFTSPARAEIRETDQSYYKRMAQSCLYTVRETWRDYLLYVPNKRTDECCASSVRKMQSIGARQADNGKCPEGTQVNSLRCTTSKKWCEKIKN